MRLKFRILRRLRLPKVCKNNAKKHINRGLPPVPYIKPSPSYISPALSEKDRLFEISLESYRPRVLQRVRLKIKDADDADEVTHLTMIETWRLRDKIAQEGDFLPFVLHLAHYQCLQFWERAQRARVHTPVSLDEDSQFGGTRLDRLASNVNIESDFFAEIENERIRDIFMAEKKGEIYLDYLKGEIDMKTLRHRLGIRKQTMYRQINTIKQKIISTIHVPSDD